MKPLVHKKVIVPFASTSLFASCSAKTHSYIPRKPNPNCGLAYVLGSYTTVMKMPYFVDLEVDVFGRRVGAHESFKLMLARYRSQHPSVHPTVCAVKIRKA